MTFERHKFNTRDQNENETIDQHVTALRILWRHLRIRKSTRRIDTQ